MATITVTFDDERHPDHEAAMSYWDNHGNVDWDDLNDDLFPPEEIEVDDGDEDEHDDEE